MELTVLSVGWGLEHGAPQGSGLRRSGPASNLSHQSLPAQRGTCQGFAPTQNRVPAAANFPELRPEDQAFKKLRKQARLSEDGSWGSCLIDTPPLSFKGESQLCRARRSGAGGQRPGVPPRVQVERSEGPGSLLPSRGLNGQLPQKAAAAEAAPGALGAARGPLGLGL